MRLTAALLLATASVLPLATPAAAQEAWSVAPTDITLDPDVRYGVLENGMRYAIRSNDYRPGQAAVRMRFGFGSIGEADNEQGLAHFIEHMAFNGTTNVPEGEMVSILERLGLAFGADTNASTGFDETIYMLNLPQVDDERVDTALFLMRETASEVLFDPEAVERERGVILGERRVRNTFGLRAAIDSIRFFLPDTPYAERLPIGTEEVLTGAPAERLKALYHRYYRPDNATLVFVGDIDPDAIEAKIVDVFGDWQAVGPEGDALARGSIDFDRPAEVGVFVDPAIQSALTLRINRPYEDPADTIAERRDALLTSLVRSMFNNRMQRIVNQPGSVLLGASLSTGTDKDLALSTTLSATTRDGEWQSGLETLEQEARRALEYGFTQREWDRVVAERRQVLETAVSQTDTRTHSAIAGGIVEAVDENSFVTTPAYRLELFDAAVATMELDEANRRMSELFEGSAPLIHVTSKTPVEPAAVTAALAASRAVEVAAAEDSDALEFAYADWGEAGTVVADETIADLGIRTLRFDNGVRLNLKSTDFEENRLTFVVEADADTISIDERTGHNFYLQFASATAGTGRHSFEEIDEIVAGRPITTGLGARDDRVQMEGSTTPEAFALQMQVAAAYLTDFGYREAADARWSNLVDLLFKQLTSTPGNVYGLEMPEQLTGGDPRFGLPSQEEAKAIGSETLRAQLGDALASGAITVSVVGDFEDQAVIDAVASTFGALDERDPPIADYDIAPVTFVPAGTTIELQHEGEADQALVAAVWPTDDDEDFETEVGLSLLKSVMNLKLTDKVREELGASYGVSVSSTMSQYIDGMGYLSANAVIDPARMDETLDAYREVAQALRTNTIDADTLQRAKAPMIERARERKEQNGYWIAYARQAQKSPERLDRARRYDDVLASIGADELQALAQRYLTEENLRIVRVTSDKLAAR